MFVLATTCTSILFVSWYSALYVAIASLYVHSLLLQVLRHYSIIFGNRIEACIFIQVRIKGRIVLVMRMSIRSSTLK